MKGTTASRRHGSTTMQTHHAAHLVGAKYPFFGLGACLQGRSQTAHNATVLHASSEPKRTFSAASRTESVAVTYFIPSKSKVAGFLSNAQRGPAETARGPTPPVSIGSLLVPSSSVPATRAEIFQRLANAMPRQGPATAASTPSGAPERGPRTSTPQGEPANK